MYHLQNMQAQHPSNLLRESFKFTQLCELLNLPKVRKRQLCEHKMPAGKLPAKRIFRNILRNFAFIYRASRDISLVSIHMRGLHRGIFLWTARYLGFRLTLKLNVFRERSMHSVSGVNEQPQAARKADQNPGVESTYARWRKKRRPISWDEDRQNAKQTTTNRGRRSRN